MANCVDPDETSHYDLFHLDLHCLQNKLSRSAKSKGFTILTY